MSVDVLKLTLGPLQTNCYVLGDDGSGDALVIDPADHADLLVETARGRGWTIGAILATHGHFDHVLASGPLQQQTDAPFYAHRADLPMIQALVPQVREWMGISASPPAEVTHFVGADDNITLGGIVLEVLHTPGHSPGHVSYVLRERQMVFSGDCLFRGSVGRADLPGGDYETLMRSITTQLLPLGDAFTVAPGHMENTTIGYERTHNPYLLDYLGRTF